MCVCLPADMELTEAEQRRQVEEQVEMLLSGQGSEVSGCDVGLEQSKPATLRKNVTYIVCGVIFNDKVLCPDWLLQDWCQKLQLRQSVLSVCVCVCAPSGGGADGAGGEAGLLQAVVPACREGGGRGESGGGAEEGGETHTHTHTQTHSSVFFGLRTKEQNCLQVKEEAGFDCEPITLLLIQEQGPQWIRFIFLAKITGQRSHSVTWTWVQP